MSNSRNRSSAISACFQSAGLPSSAIHWPATSSITTNPGSCRPLSRAAMVAAGTPERDGQDDPGDQGEQQAPGARVHAPREGRPKQHGCHRSPGARGRLAQSRAEEGGDGPGPERLACAAGVAFEPRPAARFTHSVPLSSPPAEPAQVLQHFRIEDRRADLVDAHGPLAQVDLAAAVAAEREVFVLCVTSMPQVGQRRTSRIFSSEPWLMFYYLAILRPLRCGHDAATLALNALERHGLNQPSPRMAESVSAFRTARSTAPRSTTRATTSYSCASVISAR